MAIITYLKVLANMAYYENSTINGVGKVINLYVGGSFCCSLAVCLFICIFWHSYLKMFAIQHLIRCKGLGKVCLYNVCMDDVSAYG